MPAAIDFYFDFSSPYGYLCSERIEQLAQRHDRSVVWHPILLGAIFKVSGQRPLVEAPLKGDYALMDMYRAAREHDITFAQPKRFPIATVAACRTVYWLLDHADAALQARAADWIHAVFRAFFTQGRAIDDTDTLHALALEEGFDADALLAASSDTGVKERLRQAVDAAITRGVFGSPTLVVDEQMFWGNDRLDQLDRWLTRGGW